MKHTTIYFLLALLLCLPLGLPAANEFPEYTDEHPLVVVCDWDFRPFEFLDSEGQPAGYNIDVLDMIFERLDIPHKFVMQEWHVATNMFQHREADLIHALFFFYRNAPYVSTHKYLNYYNLKVVRRADTPPMRPFHSLGPTDTVLLKKDDYAALTIDIMSNVQFVTEYHSPKDALTGIRAGRYKYFLWGETPLTSKIQELGIDSLVLDDTEIPPGELRIIGYNRDLIDIIDDQYTRLEQAGDLQRIYDRWFHPEREHDDTSPVALFVLGGLAAAIAFSLLLIRLVNRRVRKTVQQRSDLGQMMDQVLSMGNYAMVEWDLAANKVRNTYGHMLPLDEMNPEDFLKCMPPDEAKMLHNLDMQLISGASSHFDMHLSVNHGTPDKPEWRSYYINAISEKENGKTRFIYYTTKDITDEMNEARHVQDLASKYKKMFDTNLIAMSFYDAKGHLLDVNNKMLELCHIENIKEHPFTKTSLFDLSNLKGVYMPGARDVMHVCQHLREPSFGLDKYIEFRIYPVITDDNKLVYYIVTCRDITAERNAFLEQRAHDRRLQATNDAISRYERQLHYLLEESHMYIWTYRPSENVVRMTRSPGITEFSETVEDYLGTIDEEFRQQAAEQIRQAMAEGKAYVTIMPFASTPLDPNHSWYSVSGMPIFDKDGQLKEYFGLARNITDLMEAQQQLRVETERAENSGRLKAAFLANMTHEIRTPLNAIVGFSSLLQAVDTDEERHEFIRIIRNNCDMLLRLINDILEASNMGQSMALQPEDVELSVVFDDICLSLAQRVQEPGVEFQKDNPYPTCPATLDKGRIMQLLTNFVTNAVKYTRKGHIRVGYRKEQRKGIDGLYFYCEDTGAGIPKDKQAAVFQRFVKLNDFVQGTGLGLSICKSIVDRCGGEIGVTGDVGVGSTFWFWIPRDLT